MSDTLFRPPLDEDEPAPVVRAAPAGSDAARGILVGIAISSCMWAAIVAAAVKLLS